jgi:hypothetical protein
VSHPAGELPANDFMTVDEQFCSKGEQYIIGTIQFDTLINASWLKHSSVIFTEDTFDSFETSRGAQ